MMPRDGGSEQAGEWDGGPLHDQFVIVDPDLCLGFGARARARRSE